MQERLYFSDIQLCPVRVNDQIAYLFNLSSGGICFVSPKSQKNVDLSDEVKLEMSPLRLDSLKCHLKIKHQRSDEHYHYFGGEFKNLKEKDQKALVAELQGAKKRKTIKKAPVFGASWLLASFSIFYLLTGFQF